MAGYENQRVRGRPEFNLQHKQTGRDTKLSCLNRHPDEIYMMAGTMQRTALIKSLVDQEGRGVSHSNTMKDDNTSVQVIVGSSSSEHVPLGVLLG